MNNCINQQRTLAYKRAHVIQHDELEEIHGGGMSGTTSFTTKQTFDFRGNWDVGGDIRWD